MGRYTLSTRYGISGVPLSPPPTLQTATTHLSPRKHMKHSPVTPLTTQLTSCYTKPTHFSTITYTRHRESVTFLPLQLIRYTSEVESTHRYTSPSVTPHQPKHLQRFKPLHFTRQPLRITISHISQTFTPARLIHVTTPKLSPPAEQTYLIRKAKTPQGVRHTSTPTLPQPIHLINQS